jgi:hypothetical protein
MSEYIALGLKLSHADNSVEAGLLRLYQQLADGSHKIFATCTQLLADLMYYHRNERGQVVKKQDHLIDHCATQSWQARCSPRSNHLSKR